MIPSEQAIAAEMKATGFDRLPCIRRLQSREYLRRRRLPEIRLTSDGLSATERCVLDHWDGGLSIKRICKATGIPENRVGNILYNLEGASEERAHRSAMARGSAELLAAIKRAGAQK